MSKLAVILAAGRGTRLANTGHESPKGFLQLGEKPIVEESLLRLKSAGYEKVWIVTGHRAEFYEALARRYPDFVQTKHNEHYAHTGSLYSLCCLKDEIRQPFAVLESDLIYETRALSALDGSADENVLLLSGFTQSGDEVYVETILRNDKLFLKNMSKDRARLAAPPSGEFVGINRVSAVLFQSLCKIMQTSEEAVLKYDYETNGFVSCARDHHIVCVKIENLVWAEIDDAAHLERARKSVYPKIIALSE